MFSFLKTSCWDANAFHRISKFLLLQELWQFKVCMFGRISYKEEEKIESCNILWKIYLVLQFLSNFVEIWSRPSFHISQESILLIFDLLDFDRFLLILQGKGVKVAVFRDFLCQNSTNISNSELSRNHTADSY